MERELYTPRILERIMQAEEGTIFVPSDFKDIAERETVKKALLRLCNNNVIRRLVRGVYEKPEYNYFLQEHIAPSPDKIAKAIARNYGWTIIPEGDTALNILGLTTQVPNVWHYVSDGPYKQYQYNNIEFKFKHITNKEITNLSPKSSLIVQAIKALGENNINNKSIQILARNLTNEEIIKLLNETKYTSYWIFKSIKMIAKAGEANV
ncbi:MAG TPA: DUF6088 family protein [Anaerovoracaceae bacterium]|nr:DUF6088 family protein [Anaerovoracaceae bacterium]